MVKLATIFQDGFFFSRLATKPLDDIGGILGDFIFVHDAIECPTPFFAHGNQSGGGQQAEVLRGRGRRQRQKLLYLADAKLSAFSESAEDADAIQVGEGFGDGKDGAHDFHLRYFAKKRNIQMPYAQEVFLTERVCEGAFLMQDYRKRLPRRGVKNHFMEKTKWKCCLE